jgi:Immunoglobulin domain
VLQSPSPPQYVFWYHNERMINYDTSRGGVTVSTEPGPKTHSRLIINSATLTDSGNYSCRASNTDPDFIQVFVSKGRSRDEILFEGLVFFITSLILKICIAKYT